MDDLVNQAPVSMDEVQVDPAAIRAQIEAKQLEEQRTNEEPQGPAPEVAQLPF